VSSFVKTIFLLLVFIRPFWGSSEPSSHWFFLLLLLLLLLLLSFFQQKIYKTSIDPFLFLFVLFVIIGIFKSFSKYEAIEVGCQFLSYFLIYYLIVQYQLNEKIVKFVVLSSCLLICLYGIYQYFFGLAETRRFVQIYSLSPLFSERLSSDRIFSTFVYPNSLAGYLVLVFPLVLSIKNRLIFLLLSVTILYTLWLSHSRGGIITLFFTIVLFFLLRKKRLFVIISVGLFFITAVYYSIPPPSSLLARLSYWRVSVDIIKDNPLGCGLSTFPSMYFKYKKFGDEGTRNAHNDYIQLGVELGIFGAISFIILFIFSAIKGMKLARDNPSIEGFYIGAMAFFFHSTVEFLLYLPEISLVFFLFLSMVFKCERKEAKKTMIFSIILPIPIIILSIYSYKMMNASNFYEKAMAHLFVNEYEDAEISLSKAVLKNPNNPEWLVILGNMKEKKGKYDEAYSLYRKAVLLNPYFPYYNFYLERLLVKTKDKEGPFFLNKACSLYPGSTEKSQK